MPDDGKYFGHITGILSEFSAVCDSIYTKYQSRKAYPSIDLSNVKFADVSFSGITDYSSSNYFDSITVNMSGWLPHPSSPALGSAITGSNFSSDTVHVRLMEVDVPDLYSWPAEVRQVIVRQRAQAGFLLLPVWSGFFVPDQNQAADVAALAVGENPGSGHWYSLLNGVTGAEGAALLERLIAELNRDPESYLKLMSHTCDYGNFVSRLQAMTDAVAGYAGLALWWEVK